MQLFAHQIFDERHGQRGVEGLITAAHSIAARSRDLNGLCKYAAHPLHMKFLRVGGDCLLVMDLFFPLLFFFLGSRLLGREGDSA
jgi:hypothetical protein